MATKRWPEISPDSVRESLEVGLGGSRLKEYDLAPYAQMVSASIPDDLWSGIFFSWLSMKGHLQGLHDLERTEMFATKVEGRVYATFITVWTRQEAFAQWLRHGYPVEEMLRSMGVAAEEISMLNVRDFS
ncbi:MAG: hypothetical protein ACYC6B_08660 [Thermoleophilia bacterium]